MPLYGPPSFTPKVESGITSWENIQAHSIGYNFKGFNSPGLPTPLTCTPTNTPVKNQKTFLTETVRDPALTLTQNSEIGIPCICAQPTWKLLSFFRSLGNIPLTSLFIIRKPFLYPSGIPAPICFAEEGGRQKGIGCRHFTPRCPLLHAHTSPRRETLFFPFHR